MARYNKPSDNDASSLGLFPEFFEDSIVKGPKLEDVLNELISGQGEKYVFRHIFSEA